MSPITIITTQQKHGIDARLPHGPVERNSGGCIIDTEAQIDNGENIQRLLLLHPCANNKRQFGVNVKLAYWDHRNLLR